MARPDYTLEDTAEMLRGKWHELKGKVKQQWGELTDDDVMKVDGKQEELAGLLRQRYGYTNEQAEREINDWLRGQYEFYNEPKRR